MLYIFAVFFSQKLCPLWNLCLIISFFFGMEMVSFEIENTRNTTQAGPFLSHCLYTTNIDYEFDRMKKQLTWKIKKIIIINIWPCRFFMSKKTSSDCSFLWETFVQSDFSWNNIARFCFALNKIWFGKAKCQWSVLNVYICITNKRKI